MNSLIVKTPVRVPPKGIKFQGGQALTEFVIGAAFVMVPLFLLISVAGKNVDIKYATVQAARYEAWEFTANYFDQSQIEAGFTAISKTDLPVKSGLEVRREARRRFYSDTSIPINSRFDKRGYDAADVNRLWRYHDGFPMIDPAIGNLSAPASLDPNETSPDLPVPVIMPMLNVLDAVLSAFERLLSAVGIAAGFTAIDANGLAESDLAVRVADSRSYGVLSASGRAPLMPDLKDLQMHAKASVLTTNWSAGGAEHTTFQTRGLVPTVLLDELLSPGGFDLRSLVTWLPPLNEFDSANLEFGKLLTDEGLHPTKIEEDSGTHSCDKAGVCAY